MTQDLNFWATQRLCLWDNKDKTFKWPGSTILLISSQREILHFSHFLGGLVQLTTLSPLSSIDSARQTERSDAYISLISFFPILLLLTLKCLSHDKSMSDVAGPH